jgi:hypothetical protein
MSDLDVPVDSCDSISRLDVLICALDYV